MKLYPSKGIGYLANSLWYEIAVNVRWLIMYASNNSNPQNLIRNTINIPVTVHLLLTERTKDALNNNCRMGI